MAIERTIQDFVRTQGRALYNNRPSQLAPTIGQTNSYVNSLKPPSIRSVSEVWGKDNLTSSPIVQPVPEPPVSPYVFPGYVLTNYVENTY